MGIMEFSQNEAKHLYVGISLKILHSFIFTIMSVLLVQYSQSLPIIQVLFCRVFIGALFSFFILKLLKRPIPLRMTKKSVMLYLLRALISFIAMGIWVVSLKNVGINESVALGYITPVWLILIAVLFFKEKLTLQHVVVISLNIFAAMLILQPKFSTVDGLSLIAGLGSGLLWSIYNSICKKQAETEHYVLQCFYTFVFSVILMLPFAIYLWEPIILEQFLGLSLIGCIGAFNVSVLFLAYSYAPLITLIPFDYLRLLFSMVLSYILFGAPLTFEFVIGAIIISTTDLYFYIMQRNKPLYSY